MYTGILVLLFDFLMQNFCFLSNDFFYNWFEHVTCKFKVQDRLNNDSEIFMLKRKQK